MASNLEGQIKALRGYPIGKEITEDPEQYQLWFIANFEPHLSNKSIYENRECRSHLERLAELESTPYDSTLSEVHNTYISFLQARTDRLTGLLKESMAGKFAVYSAATGSYLEKIAEAVDDHLGKSPENIECEDLEAMSQIYDHVRNAHALTATYGYPLSSQKRDEGGYQA